MPARLTILCVHGVGHGDIDPNLQPTWTASIQESLQRWNPSIEVSYDFLVYDHLFDHAPLNPITCAKAMARLLASGIVHGLGDLFSKKRGLFDIPEQIRWTAGMVAQWASEDKLRKETRQAVLNQLKSDKYDVVVAHSLGSLICYDTFLHNPQVIAGKRLVTLGSQIGNPFVRDLFAGRLKALNRAASWHHLFNPNDHVLTAQISLDNDNFEQVLTEFDIPNDILNHNAPYYLRHSNAVATVWREVSGAKIVKAATRALSTFKSISRKPRRRALLVGINDYPDPESRLDGCVNDVFLMSSVLQECGFDSEDIRIVLDDRATAQGILDRLHWLLDDAKAGDERVFFYSGHGAQIPSYGPRDEVDRMDECLVAHDFDWNPEHAVTDNQFFDLYSQLPYDTRFMAIFDCCHSGGMTREGGRKVRGLTPPDDIRHRALKWNAELQMWEDRPLESPNESLRKWKGGKQMLGERGATYRLGRAVGLRSLPKNVYDRTRKELGHEGPFLPIIMQACQENQLASEYRHGVTSYGAFTYSLAQELRMNRAQGINLTFNQLNAAVTNRLKTLRYDQVPNLFGPKALLNRSVPWTAGFKKSTKARSRARKR